MRLIGAGLPRTATTTQLIALEMLGLPCYHMRDMMADPETSIPLWRQALDGDGPWDELFAGKESIVDWPGSYHWRELMDVYPDAKVLLSVRSAESWVESMHNTIASIWFGDSLMHHLAMAQYQIDPVYASWLDVLKDMWVEADIMVPSGGDREEMAAGFKRWNQEVIDTVPSDRLLVWDPKDGWGPLCELPRGRRSGRAAAERQRHRELPEEPDHGPRHRSDQRVVGGQQGARGPGHQAAHRDSARLERCRDVVLQSAGSWTCPAAVSGVASRGRTVRDDYSFEGPDGRRSLPELFDGRSQLILYRFFFERR